MMNQLGAHVLFLSAILCCLVNVSPIYSQPAALRGIVEDTMGGNTNRRNDLEGGIWEYKVIERTGDKSTVLIGKIRIKQSAAFDVGGSAKGSLLEDRAAEISGDPKDPKPKGTTPFGIRPPELPKLGVIDRIAEGNLGGDRIGDINYARSNNSTKNTPKVSFTFDADDEHILTGEANVKYDTRGGGGVWRGTYTERKPDNKKKRWTFELRFIED